MVDARFGASAVHDRAPHAYGAVLRRSLKAALAVVVLAGPVVVAAAAAAASGDPTIPTLNSVSYADAGIVLSFTAPTVPDGSTISFYDFQVSHDGGSTIYVSSAANASGNTLTISGSYCDISNCSFQIRAEIDAGSSQSPWSAWVTAPALSSGPTLNSVSYTDAGIVVSFTPPTLPSGLTISYFYYQVSHDGGSTIYVSSAANASGNTLTISGSYCDISNCSVQIAAYTNGGWTTPWSTWVTAPDLSSGPTLNSVSYTDAGIVVSFTPPTLPSGLTISYFYYQVSHDGGSTIYVSSAANASGNTLTISGSYCDISNCSVQIAAYTNGGWTTPWSTWVTAPALSSGPTLNSVSYTDAGIVVSFTPPTLPSGLTISYFYYQVSHDGGSTIYVSSAANASGNTLTISGSYCDISNCSVQIAAYTNGGWTTPWSTWVTANAPYVGGGTVALSKATGLLGNFIDKVSGAGWSAHGDTSVVIFECATIRYIPSSCDGTNSVSKPLGNTATTAGKFTSALIALRVGAIDANNDTCGLADSNPCYLVVVGNTGDQSASTSLSFIASSAKLAKSTGVLGNYVDKVSVTGFPIGDTVIARECDAAATAPNTDAADCDASTQISGTVGPAGTVPFSPAGVTALVANAYADAAAGTCVPGSTCNIVVTDTSNTDIAHGLPVNFIASSAKLAKSTGVLGNYVDKVSVTGFPIGDTVIARECDAAATAPNTDAADCAASTQISGTVGPAGTVPFSPAGVTVLVANAYADAAAGTCVPGSTCNIVVTDTSNTDIAHGLPVGLAIPSLLQTSTTAATITAGAGYAGQLAVKYAVSAVTYTETASSASSAIVVNSSGAITAAPSLALGTYTVGGKDADSAGDKGTWTLTLTVKPPVLAACVGGSALLPIVPTGYVITAVSTSQSCPGLGADFNAVTLARSATGVVGCLNGDGLTVPGWPAGFAITAMSSTSASCPAYSVSVTLAALATGVVGCANNAGVDVPGWPQGFAITATTTSANCPGTGGYNAVKLAALATGVVGCANNAGVDVPGWPQGFAITATTTSANCPGTGGYNAVKLAALATGVVGCANNAGVDVPGWPQGFAITATTTSANCPGTGGYNAVKLATLATGVVGCANNAGVDVPGWPQGFAITATTTSANCPGTGGYNAVKLAALATGVVGCANNAGVDAPGWPQGFAITATTTSANCPGTGGYNAVKLAALATGVVNACVGGSALLPIVPTGYAITAVSTSASCPGGGVFNAVALAAWATGVVGCVNGGGTLPAWPKGFAITEVSTSNSCPSNGGTFNAVTSTALGSGVVDACVGGSALLPIVPAGYAITAVSTSTNCPGVDANFNAVTLAAWATGVVGCVNGGGTLPAWPKGFAITEVSTSNSCPSNGGTFNAVTSTALGSGVVDACVGGSALLPIVPAGYAITAVSTSTNRPGVDANFNAVTLAAWATGVVGCVNGGGTLPAWPQGFAITEVSTSNSCPSNGGTFNAVTSTALPPATE